MVRLFNKTLWMMTCLFMLVGISNITYAANIKLTLDRNSVSLNDSVTLFFQATGSVDDDPDFSPLEKDFSILGNQKRSNLSIINGKPSSTTEWLVEVMAKRDGKLLIPVINFGQDQSPSAVLTVKNTPVVPDQGNSSEEIFIEVEALPQEVWVQSQIIFTIKLFRSISTFNSSLSEATIKGGQVIVEKLEDRQFETSRNGQRYSVLQRRYALFPQASGLFSIEPIIFTGQVSQRSRQIFDPFGRNNSKTIKRSSRSVELNVKPVPVDYTGKIWLPAKKLQIEEKWMSDPNKLVAGEPVTRTIVIKAEGLSAEQLPEIEVSELDGFKTYPDQAEIHNQFGRDGVIGIRQEKSAIIPGKPGEFLLPAVELKWWNTQTGEMELAQLPQRMINVLPGAVGNVSSDQIEPLPVESAVVESVETENVSTSKSVNYWPWISFILALGWLVSALLWWRSRHTDEQPILTKELTLSERSTMRSLREAIRKDEPVQIKNALLMWGKSIWKENPPTNLSMLGERCGSDLSTEVALLDKSLYGAADKNWNGERLLLSVENFDGEKLQKEKLLDKKSLKPLHNI